MHGRRVRGRHNKNSIKRNHVYHGSREWNLFLVTYNCMYFVFALFDRIFILFFPSSFFVIIIALYAYRISHISIKLCLCWHKVSLAPMVNVMHKFPLMSTYFPQTMRNMRIWPYIQWSLSTKPHQMHIDKLWKLIVCSTFKRIGYLVFGDRCFMLLP